MTVFLRERAVDAVEEMDRPDCDPRKLNRSYGRFPVVNRAVSGWRGIYKDLLRPVLAASPSPSLLDIGCGGGDVVRWIEKRAAKDGLKVRITAIDPDERAFRFAVRARTSANIAFRQAFSSELLAEGQTFDVVISNHVLHHLRPDEFQGLLKDSERLCRRLVVHNDIERSPIAFCLFGAGAWMLGIGSYIWRDGLTSIRRSYTAPELRSVAPPGWTVERRNPFRNLLLFQAEGADG